MPRATLFVLLALAGPAHAAPAAAPPAGNDVAPVGTPTSREATTPARSEARPDLAATPPGEGPPAAGSAQLPSEPAGTPTPASVPGATTTAPEAEPPASADASGKPPAEIPGSPGAGTSGAATSGPAEAGAAPVAGHGAPTALQALPLPPSTARLAVSGVLGRTVDGSDGQDIGRVVDVLVDGNGQPRAAVIDFGGFMGLGSRKIAVEWGAFSFPPGGSDAVLRIVLSPEQIKDTPEYAGPGKPVTVVGPGTPVPRPGP
ncbi:MAG: PRC-barrel domain-containing protein [Janthinobacterium lividum]